MTKNDDRLPPMMTAEEKKVMEHDISHHCVHIIVEGRSITQDIIDAAHAGDIHGEDEGNTRLHHMVEALSRTELRNALMISIALVDTDLLKEAIHEYCHTDPEGETHD